MSRFAAFETLMFSGGSFQDPLSFGVPWFCLGAGMRVAGRAGNGWRSVLLRQLGRRVRRVATGTGMLALAVPLAWPSGAGGQHLDVPSAASVRAGVVRLADFVSGQSSPAPALPVQQA